MLNYLNYKSVMASHIKFFVESKTRKGIKGEDIKWVLYELDQYLAEKNHQTTTVPLKIIIREEVRKIINWDRK